ncbi:Uncharacterized protein Fot_20086 [Forsythia ovata]|uniref:Uncharacterized protein n=1 Tax=Forsythia ovata TaxID=205694 RepID=A0ABD1VMV7_9LAMI
MPHTGIEPALPEDFSPRHFKPYQIAYAPRGKINYKLVGGRIVPVKKGKGRVREELEEESSFVEEGSMLGRLEAKLNQVLQDPRRTRKVANRFSIGSREMAEEL